MTISPKEISSDKLPVLAIVVPCYNEEEVLNNTTEALLAVLDGLKIKSKIAPSSYILYVDDGSSDKTWEIISGYNKTNPGVKGIKLSRNSGHQNALLAGLCNVKDRADCAISIDADLQDDVSIIEEMMDKFNEGFEIVYGVRKERKTDSLFKKSTALAFYKLMHIMGVKITYNHADYRLAGKRALKHLFEFKEVNLFLRGIFPLIGFKSANVYYDRKERQAGESKYPLKKMLSFAFDGITSFSVIPLRIVTTLGALIFIFAGIMIIYALFSYIAGKVVQGWTSTILAIYFIGGIQIMSIGLVGEYIGKIYKETKARPRFIVEEEIF